MGCLECACNGCVALRAHRRSAGPSAPAARLAMPVGRFPWLAHWFSTVHSPVPHDQPSHPGADARNRRRVPHRDILRRRVRFRTAVPLRDAELEALITDTFRLQYLKGPLGSVYNYLLGVRFSSGVGRTLREGRPGGTFRVPSGCCGRESATPAAALAVVVPAIPSCHTETADLHPTPRLRRFCAVAPLRRGSPREAFRDRLLPPVQHRGAAVAGPRDSG